MKKSSFIAMIMGTIGGILFALGMCMCLLPEWNAFRPGVIMGGAGFAVLLATLIVWRRMENKTPIRFSKRTVGAVALGIAGSLLLGLGMCLVMVWSSIPLGVVVGIAGIVALLSLIPLIKGLK